MILHDLYGEILGVVLAMTSWTADDGGGAGCGGGAVNIGGAITVSTASSTVADGIVVGRPPDDWGSRIPFVVLAAGTAATTSVVRWTPLRPFGGA